MFPMRFPRVRCLLCAATILIAACASQPPREARSVALLTAEHEIPSEQLLNVNVAVFDPNTAGADAKKKDATEVVYADVRNAESAYMAYNLRRTLESSGQWGAVRVVPESVPAAELQIDARIEHSDGERLRLHVRAVDATGRVWLDQPYEHRAGQLDYQVDALAHEPFQPLYNRIANDLLAQRRRLRPGEVPEIRRVSELRFAADLAPDAFASYVQERRGRYHAIGLPAEDEPMLARVAAIRERDYAVIDTLDQYYQQFQMRVDPSYSRWRAENFREAVAYRELQAQARTRKVLGTLAMIGGAVAAATANTGNGQTAGIAAAVGGAYLYKTGLEKSEEAKVNEVALKELGESLNADLQPQVVALDERTVTLSGSAKAQFREWRSLLRTLYAEETGLPVAPER